MSILSNLNNLAITTTKGLMGSVVGGSVDYLRSLAANGGRDKTCKFYYSNGGGSVLNVVTKNVVGGVVSGIQDEAVKLYQSLFQKKKQAISPSGNWNTLREEAQKKEQKAYGAIETQEGFWIHALDDWGCRSTDALMMAIELDKAIPVKGAQVQMSNEYSKTSGATTTKTLVWYDVTALITINSDKNLVVTKVQGRDYSRKELVSNGDIKFSVSGQITSKLPESYPADEVQKFIKMMQYKGVIRINNQLLDQFGITHIIIENFNLQSREGYKAVQNYTFSAIGLQPEKLQEITSDTSPYIDYGGTDIEPTTTSSTPGWSDIFKNQLEGLKNIPVDVVDGGLQYSAGLLTDLLDKKI